MFAAAVFAAAVLGGAVVGAAAVTVARSFVGIAARFAVPPPFGAAGGVVVGVAARFPVPPPFGAGTVGGVPDFAGGATVATSFFRAAGFADFAPAFAARVDGAFFASTRRAAGFTC